MTDVVYVMNEDVVVIGNGKHSKRIQKILKNKKYKIKIFTPKNKSRLTKQEIYQLKLYKILFIITPNDSHYQYISNINDSKRYIFCEKPPTNNISQLKKIKSIKLKKKIYFNFNYRFSELANTLTNKSYIDIKQLTYSNISVSHNFALKDEYKINWRSKKSKCPHGIKEMVTVHWIDLFNYIFGVKKILSSTGRNIAKNGGNNDTTNIQLETNNNAIVDIFNSYSSSLTFNITFIFKDRHLECNGNEINIYKTLLKSSSKKNTTHSKLIKKIKIRKSLSSLEKSIDFFLDKVNKNKNFSNRLFNFSIKSNELLFSN